MPRIADKQERREKIVDAAYRVIVREGLGGTSMRAVATEAGCTIGLINHWFSSRDDLVEATFERAMNVELAHAAAAVDGPASYIDAASGFLPTDGHRRDAAKIWIAFYAMVLSGPGEDMHRTARCKAIRRTMVQGLRAHFDLPTCHDIVDRVLVLVDGIAINALLDPTRWTRARQLAVLHEGLENTLAHHPENPKG
ncbi:MAG: TetR/AcrR family transcriptional regulator [Halieaceae bacterium]